MPCMWIDITVSYCVVEKLGYCLVSLLHHAEVLCTLYKHDFELCALIGDCSMHRKVIKQYFKLLNRQCKVSLSKLVVENVPNNLKKARGKCLLLYVYAHSIKGSITVFLNLIATSYTL